MKKFLTFEQVRRMWRVGPDKARSHLILNGITPKKLGGSPSIPDRVRNLKPPERVTKYTSDAWVPTQAEIRKGCLEIQSRWTEEERRKRYVGKTQAMEMLAYQWDGYGFQEKLA
jgi:hypothetical protein